MVALSLVILCVSAAALGLELVLMRALAIAHWHHFAYLVISTALLGFGSSGTLITIGQKFFRTHRYSSLWCFAAGLALTAPATFWAAQYIGFDQLRLAWDARQLLYLLGYYVLLFVPFFFGGGCICLAFTAWAQNAHQLYFFNMTGSGLGALGAVVLMYGHSPEQLLLVVSALAFLAVLILAAKISARLFTATLLGVFAVFIVFAPGGILELKIRISENKSLVYYNSLPNSKTLTTRYSPLARLDIVQAPAIRYVPGLSIDYRGTIPEQILLISDADGISTINRFEHLDDLRCYNNITSALGYHLIPKADVCIIGAGGGSDVAQAVSLGARKVTAVEMNPQIIELLQGTFSGFASDIYNSAQVKTIVAEGRSFLQTTKGRFDIIQISLLDSFTAAVAGLYALNESHLYTVEAVSKALDRLTPNGLLSITRSLKTPPRDSLKILATVNEALRAHGVPAPRNHIIMIRSWATATIVVSPTVLPASAESATRQFCEKRRFDLVCLPGLKANETNQFHVLAEPAYYTGAREILGQDAEKFYEDYAYYIRPATDDRPYFFDFLKLKALPHMIRQMPHQWLPYSEWGYFVLLATLVQAAGVSTLFILVPLIFARPLKSVAGGKSAVLAYFLLLGFAYMFLEMAFIQKMTLLIGDPVFGVAVTLVGFLAFSGCGSLASTRLVRSGALRVWIAVIAIIVIGILEINLLKFGFDWLVGFPRMGRVCLGLAICAPLAFFMGMPFPTGLAELDKQNRTLVPWAWGINGFASVTAAVLGTCLAISLGFTSLALIALCGYFLAGLISGRICSHSQ
jgi:hypothetical protein